jgi:general secretion pathway protein J
MTLLEVLVSIGILGVMLSLAYSTTARVGQTRRTIGDGQERSAELRIALARVALDLEHAYLSKNENLAATERRTSFVGKEGGEVDELSFSTLAHRPLWAEANEADTARITYFAADDRDPDRRGTVNWLRREYRRLAPDGETLTDTPSDVDVVFRDVDDVTFEFWDWKDQEWRRTWDSTKQDGQKDRLPTRVRITVRWTEVFDGERVPQVLVTQARLLLQEPVESRFGTQFERGGS